jgi:carboxyl-terminal processing protease
MRTPPPSLHSSRRCRARARELGASLAVAGVLCACSGNISRTDDCSVPGRKAYVASIMSDFYLWYDRVPPVDIAAAESPEELMHQMTYPELDHWSGMQREAERTQFFDQGRFQGMGYTLGSDPDGGLRISWVHEGSAAGRAGLDRGALIIGVNGRDVEQLSPAELGAELAEDVVVHQIRELDGSVHDVELRQGDVEITSVKSVTVLDSPLGPVGYLMFTTFVRPGEEELKAAFTQFRDAGVRSLVIDLRYNGGGLLSTAALLGSLIEASAAGQPLIVETYNDLHTDMNRERLLVTTPEAVDVERVVFLTTGRTASASEQVINGLAPYVDVHVVGGRTLGKPVGADSWSHCGYSIVPITFHSLNVDGAGDYFNGIQPECEVPDDLLHRLGDPEEAQLNAALRVLQGAPCSDPSSTEPDAPLESAAGADVPKASVRRAASGGLPAGPLLDLPGWY